MLSPSEFTAAALTGADHKALVMPHDERIGIFLTLRIDQRGTFAVFLTGDDRFKFFHYKSRLDEEDAYFLKGIVIPDIAIEVDESSAYDPDNSVRLLGSLIRTQERLEILTVSASQRLAIQPVSLVILHDLPCCEASARVGFTKWQVVLGSGLEKRVLVAVDCLSGPCQP